MSMLQPAMLALPAAQAGASIAHRLVSGLSRQHRHADAVARPERHFTNVMGRNCFAKGPCCSASSCRCNHRIGFGCGPIERLLPRVLLHRVQLLRLLHLIAAERGAAAGAAASGGMQGSSCCPERHCRWCHEESCSVRWSMPAHMLVLLVCQCTQQCLHHQLAQVKLTCVYCDQHTFCLYVRTCHARRDSGQPASITLWCSFQLLYISDVGSHARRNNIA